MLRTLHDITCQGKKVLLRAELNVPIKDSRVTDDLRIRAIVPTIKVLRGDCAERVVIIAHLGRPNGAPDPALSLEPLVPLLEQALGEPVAFVDDCLGEAPETGIVLMENLRFHPGEEENSIAFAKRLSNLGDIYINDAFGAMHRAHASVDALPRLFTEKAAGLLVEKEIAGLDLSAPEPPFVALIGAAKISDKIKILESLLQRVDNLLLGGAIVFPFFKAKGWEVGKSLCEEQSVPVAMELLENHGSRIILPQDIVVSEDLDGSDIYTVDSDKIPVNMKGLDIGDLSIDQFKSVLEKANTVFWNGPLGVFETEPFDHATNRLAEFLAQSKARVIVGGGDTAAAVNELGLTHFFAHVSTGGGAALEYVTGKKLPGLQALE